ncbi:MAG TPA: hypothetical protein VK453_25065 [Micromonosporaceae bacterium]|nr:hypothetical protein [Micromonosporaceae bacterium]
MRRTLLVVLTIALAGCTSAQPEARITAEPSAARAAVTSPTADLHGRQACDIARSALRRSEHLDQATAQAVVAFAGQSLNEKLRQHGAFLSLATNRAIASKGASDEAAMSAAATTKAFEFVAACFDNGYGG